MPSESRILSFAVTAIVAAVAWGVTGCGGGYRGGGGGSAPPANGVVTVYPGTVTVSASSLAEVHFRAFLPSQPTATFTWSVNGGSNNGTMDATTGVYTPPSSVPSPATVTVTATDTAATNEIGKATITITAAQVLTVSPGALAILAGASQTFAATSGTPPVPVAAPTWEVNGVAGGNSTDGTISTAGVYTAPLTPPSGGTVTITAVSGGNNGTAAATILFSNNSLNGGYAFSYSGSDSSGINNSPEPLAVAGSFTANPSAGAITGLEDYNSGGASTVALALPVSGTYQVNPDGSGTAVLNNVATISGTEAWQFTLGAGRAGSASRHAVLVRFDNTATGSGSIDRQNTAQLSNLSAISGNYVFGLSGADSSLFPLQLAGIFDADGSGNIPANAGEEDINDAGISTQANAPDLSLHGTYSLDLANAGSGRGNITLTNSSSQYACTCQFAFYMVDSTHLKVVEIDRNALLSGDVYAAPSTAHGGYGDGALSGAYAFTLGGADLTAGGAYAQGGIFSANGAGGVTGGIVDTNDGGSTHLNQSLTASSYAVDPNFGRIALPMTIGKTTVNFAAYPAANNLIEMISLDPNYMDSGSGFLQSSTAAPQGAFALDLGGIVNSGGSEEDVAGQVVLSGNSTPTGTLAINNSGSFVTGVPLGSASSFAAPSSNGRGTASLASHLATYPLLYYTVDANTALLLESDGSRTILGTLSRQF